MDYSSRFLTTVRYTLQKIGIVRPLLRLYRRCFQKNYEQSFHKALLNAIHPGDTVWDVGANVGLYSIEFSGLTGETGQVIAFEPSPHTAQALKAAVSSYPNVHVEQVALSNFDGYADFYVSGNSTTDSLRAKAEAGTQGTMNVQVMRGDEYAGIAFPQVIKIDVEGFELEVLQGLTKTLEHSELRSVLIEIHFAELRARGLVSAPRDAVEILRSCHFDVIWVDASHIVASRA